MRRYCSICGNQLDPKIHYKPGKLGKTSKEVAKLQGEVLSLLLKSYYIEDKASKEKFYFESLVDLCKEGNKTGSKK